MKISIMHRNAGILALVMISIFFSSTVVVETLGTDNQIARVKTSILYAIPVLIGAMMIAGATGFRMADGNPKGLASKKFMRMKIAAALGIVVLAPAAYVLEGLATQGNYGNRFMLIQGLELIAGAVNLTLISLNARDGMRMKRNWSQANSNATAS